MTKKKKRRNVKKMTDLENQIEEMILSVPVQGNVQVDLVIKIETKDLIVKGGHLPLTMIWSVIVQNRLSMRKNYFLNVVRKSNSERKNTLIREGYAIGKLVKNES